MSTVVANSTTHFNQRNRSHKEMPFPLSELPLELQDLIMKHVHQLEECDKQHEIVAQNWMDCLKMLCCAWEHRITLGWFTGCLMSGMLMGMFEILQPQIWGVLLHLGPACRLLRQQCCCGCGHQGCCWDGCWDGQLCSARRLKRDSAPSPVWLRINLALLASVCVSSVRVRLSSLQCCSSHALYILLAV